MGALASLYRSRLSQVGEQEVIYIPSFHEATDEAKELVGQATTLVQQVLDFAPRIGDLPTVARVHLVTHVTAAFLWPYAGTPHPSNRAEPLLEQSGPYNAELGDWFLNCMIAKGVPPNNAVARYLTTDVAGERRMDRRMELFLEKQRTRDAACGFGTAEYIEANFRDTQLFRSPNHPEIGMAAWFAREVFGSMGEDPQPRSTA